MVNQRAAVSIRHRRCTDEGGKGADFDSGRRETGAMRGPDSGQLRE
jgi:hypothetical protein